MSTRSTPSSASSFDEQSTTASSPTIPPAACAASEPCPTNHAATQCAKVEKLVTALPAQWRALVGVAAFAGLRQGEALALRPQDIDFDHYEITITRSLQHPHPQFSVKQRLGPPKSPSAIRSVPIRPHLAALLDPHLAEHVEPNQWQLLFSRNARPVLPIWFHSSAGYAEQGARRT